MGILTTNVVLDDFTDLIILRFLKYLTNLTMLTELTVWNTNGTDTGFGHSQDMIQIVTAWA